MRKKGRQAIEAPALESDTGQLQSQAGTVAIVGI